MDEGEIQERVSNILLDLLDVEAQDIIPSAAFLTDLGASSVEFVEIMAAFENEFAIRIRDEDIEKIHSVQSAIDYLGARLR